MSMRDRSTGKKRGQADLITTEIYVIPWRDQYVIYAPSRRIAFIGNAATVNFIDSLRQGKTNIEGKERVFLEFLRKIRLVGTEGDVPITAPGNFDFKPT